MKMIIVYKGFVFLYRKRRGKSGALNIECLEKSKGDLFSVSKYKQIYPTVEVKLNITKGISSTIDTYMTTSLIFRQFRASIRNDRINQILS